ncbi:Cell shape-determining protein [Lapidilactobacillus concavus DSM 17758]|jgi:rod shape-determining protein MreC|uniref:Cell shape-determining protein MreC n=1 Tax=Lapidilactobacillus concavus DSM 17758 TaxID=1423735 RepID=A0A0R1VS00_9LACO|nr:rod shape-determining protein MreC [Lapidilactobacillus concavus]KRM08536.1 Cell shape-determining protein [Lapidilactobacillus concavus DSM 17758]GEL13008.1 cell shape-determining protein MreC [Lapidilactobacillus concavus]
MNKFFSNKKLIIVMVTLIAVFGMLSASISLRDNRQSPEIVQRVGNDAFGIVGHVITTPINAVRSVTTNVRDLFNAFEENSALKSELQTLAETKVENQTLKNENRDLKKQLKLNNTLTDYEQITAAVMSRSPVNWQNDLIINRGSSAGITKNMPVMSGSGLVGRVIEVNKTNSKVELISSNNNSSNRFAAEISTGNETPVSGLITDFDHKTATLVMSHLVTADKVKKGQQVITSGLGGLTPRGLLVGTVAKVTKDNYGLASTIYVKPAANLNNFSVVTVISRSIEDK